MSQEKKESYVDPVLEVMIQPLAEYFAPEFVEEIAINRAGEVWMRLHGVKVPWVKCEAPHITKKYLLDLIHIVANIYERPFEPMRGIPVVYVSLPGNHRFTAIAGPNVLYDDDDLTGGVALNIRGAMAGDADFARYGLEKGKALTQIKKKTSVRPNDPYERLMQAIEDGSPILISGATSTGKTTVLNHILSLLDKDLRILTVEDAREIKVPQENRVHFLLSRTEQNNQFDYPKLLDLIVRMTPDVIIGGEISVDNASIMWELMGTGHDHFYATIHAESAEAAYGAFADRILHTQPAYNRADLISEMKKKVRVVQLARDGAKRAIIDVV